ncbi:signal peptide peptidase SppA [Rickettsiales endosymbiont of Peranema trichophorum]|uniref:signal peptide peptidase SppA n=1 Tax=Rickettsiales endosymbiont of Peranema trichophorum TaxID=2486577 RepID=UPI0010230EA0|nr:signal peptide peptidase SppA [Rickettsiales endosymbiont of Peranema trichophorum]RZI47193.1 signal peptide peptidase SppA [Rickettsiales endosymbiont of Peranema trichophorum]
MSITPDQILDRYKLKSQLSRWRFLSLVFLGIALALMFRDYKPANSGVYNRDYIARINIEGFIFDNPQNRQLLSDIETNDNIKAVIVHVDSGGGSVVGGESLYRALRKVAERKPVAIMMHTMATSAAYMVALGGDYIVAYEGTLTGSIGVIAQTFEITELAKNIGITLNTLKTAPYKASPNEFEQMTPQVHAYLDALLKELQRMFLGMVQERRKLSDAELSEIGEGKVYTGSQALKLGLIDAIGDEETAKQWLIDEKQIGKDLKIHDVVAPKPLGDLLQKYLDSISDLLLVVSNGTGVLSKF